MSDRPRVLHLSPEFPPAVGGIGDYACWLTQGLAEHGFEIRVLTRPCSIDADANGYSVSATLEHWDRRLWRSVAGEIRSFRPDILHIEYQHIMYGGHPAIGWLPSVLTALRLRPFVVTTLHDMTRPTEGPRWARRLAFEALLQSSDRVLVTSEANRRGVARRPGLARRTSLVSIGSNIALHPLTADEKAQVRASICSDPDAFLLVCFGLIRRGKGLEVLVDAVAALRRRSIPVELALIGDVGYAEQAFRHAYREQLLEQRHSLGLDGAVHVLGHLPEDKLSAVLQASDAGVLPFLGGVSAGHTTAIAMLSHGLPLVATRSAGTPGEYSDAMALVDAPPDANALAAAIQAVLVAPERRRELAVKGGELAAFYSRPSIVERIAALYKEGVRRPAPLQVPAPAEVVVPVAAEASQAPNTPTATLPLR